MDSYTIFGCMIVIILIVLIFRKLNASIEKSDLSLQKRSGDIAIINYNGEVPLTKEKFVNILSQFKENLEQAIPYIDSYNSYELQKSAIKANKTIQKWIDKQNDPVFVLTKENVLAHEENIIENEKEQLYKKNISINDLMYNSKKETETPIEDEKDINTIGLAQDTPEKTREIIISLAKKLQIIITIICNNNHCILIDVVNVIPFEKLMNKIKKNVISNNEYSNYQTSYSDDQKFAIGGRDNATLMDCYKGECGLTDDSFDSSSMVMEKYKTINNSFPHISTRYDNTNLNRFSTVIR